MRLLFSLGVKKVWLDSCVAVVALPKGVEQTTQSVSDQVSRYTTQIIFQVLPLNDWPQDRNPPCFVILNIFTYRHRYGRL